VLLCACASAPVVTGDSRGFFDTAKGMYGGNEFDARSAEGKITVANEPQAASASAATAGASGAAVTATAAAAPPAATPPQPDTSDVPIAIDTNAFAAVFGPTSNPVRPSAEQLMRLDSLSLIAGDATRVELQQKILACRRAGDRCRIARN
jgi:hypothetical protein